MKLRIKQSAYVIKLNRCNQPLYLVVVNQKLVISRFKPFSD